MEVRYSDYFEDVDATPERLKHARLAGLGAEQVEIYLPSGMASGSKRRQIERPLVAAERFGWICAKQREAAEEFTRHMIGARSQLGYVTSSWRDVIDGSPVFNSPVDRRSFHENQLRRALAVMHEKCREPFLDWMVISEQRDTSVQEFGMMMQRKLMSSPLQHKEAQKASGINFLNIILQDLAYHFGLIERSRGWDTRRQLERLLARNGQAF